MEGKVKDMDSKTKNFKDMKAKGDELEKKNQESKSDFEKRKHQSNTVLNQAKDKDAQVQQQVKQVVDVHKQKELELKDKQKKLQATLNMNYQEFQKKDQDFEQLNEQQDKKIAALKDEISGLKNDIKKSLDDINHLDTKIQDHEEARVTMSGELTETPVEKDTPFDPAGLEKAQKEADDLKKREQGLADAKQQKEKEKADLQKDHDAKEKELDALQDHADVDKDNRQDRDKKKIDFELKLDNQKKIFDDNVQKLENINDLEEDIEDKEKQLIELNGIIHTLMDQNEFERKCGKLEGNIRDLEDDINQTQNKAQDVLTKIEHTLAKSEGDEKAQDLLDKLEKLKGDIGAIEERMGAEIKDKDANRKDLEDKGKNVNGLKLQEIKPDVLQRSLDELDQVEAAIDSNQEDQEQLKNDLAAVEQGVKDVIDEMKQRYHKMIKDTIKEIKDRDQDVEKRVGNVQNKLDDIDKAIALKQAALQDPDKIAMLDKMKNKLTDLRNKGKQINNDKDQNDRDADKQNEEGTKAGLDMNKHPQDNYDNVKLENLQDIEDNVCDIRDDGVGKAERDTDDLEKRAGQLKNELDEFDKMIIDEKLDEAKKALDNKAKELQDHEDKLKNLEDGIKELKDKIAAKEDKITQPNHKKGLDDIKKRLADLEKQAKDLRGKKDKLQKSHDDLKNKLDNTDPKDFNIEDVIDIDKQIDGMNKDSDDIKDGVKDGNDQLKKLNNDFNNLLQRIRGDKRHECGRKLKQAQNKLDDLDKKLERIQNNLDLIDKNNDFLNDDFKDAEKAKDLGELTKNVDAQKKEFEELKKKRNDAKKKYQQLEKDFYGKDIEETPVEDWIAIAAQTDDLIKGIDEDIIKADNLDKGVDKNRGKSDDQVEKYKNKKDLYDECVKERDAKKELLAKSQKRLDDVNATLQRLENDLNNISVPENDKENQDTYNKLKKEQDRLKKNLEANQNKLNDIEKKLNPLSDELDAVDRNIVTTPELQSILDRLRKLPFGDLTIDQLEADTKKHSDEVDDFCKQYRGEKLFEVDRMIKEAEDLLSKLDALHKKVKGDNDDFTQYLKDNDTDPEERERVEKIAELLKKTGLFDGDIKKIGKDKDLIRGVLDGIKQKLAQQESGDIDMSVVNDLIRDVGVCNGKIKKNIGTLEHIEEELKKMRLDFDDFLGKSQGRDQMIQDYNELVDQIQNQLDGYGPKLDKIFKLLDGLEKAAEAMDGNPDYATKQKSIEKMIAQLKDQRKQAEDAKKVVDQSQFKLDEFKQKQDNLKNMDPDDIQNLIDQLAQTLEDVSALKTPINDLERGLDNRREKLADAQIPDNVETKDQQLKTFKEKLDNADNEISDLEFKAQESIANAPDDQKEMFENVLKSIDALKDKKDDLTAKREDALKQLEQVKQDIEKVGDLAGTDAGNLKPLIDDLRDIRNIIDQIDEGIKDLESEIAVQKAKLEGLDSEKKLNELNAQLENQKATLDNCNKDLDRLKRLAENFDGLTSSAEEESFIEELHGELDEMKEKSQKCDAEADKLKQLLKDIEKFIADKKKVNPNLSNKDIDEIVTKIAHADQQVKKNQEGVDQVENFVNQKKERFHNMDLDKKFKRRQREVDELGKHTTDMNSNINTIKSEIDADIKKAQGNPEGNKELINNLTELSNELEDIQNSLKEQQPGKEAIAKDLAKAKGQLKPDIHVDKHLDLLDDNLDIKKRLRDQLKALNDAHQRFKAVKAKYAQHKNSGPKIVYKATKGDAVDELLGNWLNTHGMGLKIKRLGGGYYMFGTKKIYAKIINGKLVIRVGGGYMGIDEFMQHYGLIELQKQQRMGLEDDGEGEDIGFDELGMQDEKNIKALKDLDKGSPGGQRKTVIGIQQAKKALRGQTSKSPVSGRKSDAGSDFEEQAASKGQRKTVAGSKLQAPKTYSSVKK